MLDFSSNGSLSTKTIDKALKLFETMATTLAMLVFEQVAQKKTPRIYNVDTFSVLSVKIDSLFQKVESTSQSTNAVQAKKPSCEECEVDHNISNCPILA